MLQHDQFRRPFASAAVEVSQWRMIAVVAFALFFTACGGSTDSVGADPNPSVVSGDGSTADSGDSDDGDNNDNSDDSNNQNISPVANAGADQTISLSAGETMVAVILNGSASSDSDGTVATYVWTGSPDPDDVVGPGVMLAAGSHSFNLVVTDDTGASSAADSVTITVNPDAGGGTGSNVSINSTSQNGIPPASAVAEQPLVKLNGYQILTSNDLGMHCGDLDTRISSILPPFNVFHAQVIQRGVEPSILTKADNIEVVYSAASNPADPILTGVNSAGNGPVLSSKLPDGSVFKTNFWDIARGAYDPFYPPGILPAFYPPGDNILDLGLPAPNVERLVLGDGVLSAEQQSMPGRFGPYVENKAEPFEAFVTDQPFFNKLPFGYIAEEVNWFEAPGVPLTAFDDAGRENPWPLFRVQARDAGGAVLASTDTVAPISGEANCGFCHNAQVDGGNGEAIRNLTKVATVLDDPQLDSVPLEISKEYAADINLVRLHDQKHGTNLEASTPVVCQKCHYSPALDLAQLGPLGSGDALANGREQTSVKSMSNVMHSHHGQVEDANGKKLFPDMPPPVTVAGILRDPGIGREVMEATCYQCHPGRRTDCLRGAMATGGMLCQDCHGDMLQVGDDFTRKVTPDNPGAFEFIGNFYTDPAQPRVPWANEPGCGSCHTGDAMDNMHGEPNTIGDPQDEIRLMQAWRSNDPKATPIVPTNKRFAENVVPVSFNGTPNPGAGNPMLYRVSTGHGGVFCEGCHGATHGIWPNGNPNANDNVAAIQLQGHTGTITECVTCHEASAFEKGGELAETLEGPHGMHPVGNTWFGTGEGHEDVAETKANECRACHGRNGEGTALSRMPVDRTLIIKECKKGTLCPGQEIKNFPVDIPKGTQITCVMCHENELE